MPLRLFIEAGAEYLLPFAKKKLALLKARAARAGVRVLSANYTATTGERIYIQTSGRQLGTAAFSQDLIRLNAAPTADLFRALREPATASGTTVYRTDLAAILDSRENTAATDVDADLFDDADWSRNGSTYVSMLGDINGGSTTLTVVRAGVTAELENVFCYSPDPGFAASVPAKPFYFDPAAETRAFRFAELRSEFGPPFVISANGKRVIAQSSVHDELFVVANWNDATSTFDVTRVAVPDSYTARIAAFVALGAGYASNSPAQWGTLSWTGSLPSWPADSEFNPDPGVLIDDSQPVEGKALLHPASSRYAYFFYRMSAAPETIVDDYEEFLNVAHGGSEPDGYEYGVGVIRNVGTAYSALLRYDFDTGTWSSVRDSATAVTSYAVHAPALAQTGTPLSNTLLADPGQDCEQFLNLLLHPTGDAEVLTIQFREYSDTDFSWQLYPTGVWYSYTYAVAAYLSSFDAIIDGVTVSENWASAPLPGEYDFSNARYWESAANGRFVFKSETNAESPVGSKEGYIWRYSSTGELVLDVTANPDRRFRLSKDGSWLFASDGTGAATVYVDGASAWTDADIPSPYTDLSFLAPSLETNSKVYASCLKDGVPTLVTCAFSADSLGVYSVSITDITTTFITQALIPSTDDPADVTAEADAYAIATFGMDVAAIAAMLGMGTTSEQIIQSFLDQGVIGNGQPEISTTLESVTPDECFPRPRVL